MSIRDTIVTGTRSVVTALAETWTLYARTGGLDNDPTWSGSGTSITVISTQYSKMVGGSEYLSEDGNVVQLRISDAVSISLGDKVNNGADDYVIIEQLSGSTGTNLYRARFVEAREFGPSRGARLER